MKGTFRGLIAAASSKRRRIDADAFAAGFSGAGLLVVAPPVHSLRRGETIVAAWSRVGEHLNSAATKVAHERRETAGRKAGK